MQNPKYRRLVILQKTSFLHLAIKNQALTLLNNVVF